MLSILSYIRQGEPFLAIIVILSRCFVVFCCMPIHELAHALIANKLGDDTAKLKGRISINPFAHLDLIGTIMIFLFGIGYAKPVPVMVMYVIIYGFVWIATGWLVKRDEIRINEAIKEIQDEE